MLWNQQEKGVPTTLIKKINEVNSQLKFFYYLPIVHMSELVNRCNGRHIFVIIFLEAKEEKQCFLDPYILTLIFSAVFTC